MTLLTMAGQVACFASWIFLCGMESPMLLNGRQKFELGLRIQKQGLKIASRGGFDYLRASGLKRPEWLYRDDVKIPRYELTFAPGLPPTPADVALCARLIAAYQQACPEPIGNTGATPLWSTIIDRHFQPLLTALQRGDAKGLADLLSTAFQQSILHGITSADRYKGVWLTRLWYLKCLDDLVSLAEYLGVARTENPEQGPFGDALKDGAEPLVRAIEAAAGIEMGFPAVGAPYGLQIGRSMITMETPEHTYAALQVNQAIDRNLPTETVDQPNIVEIGAGFGGTAYRLLKLRAHRIRSYTIIDLPLINVMQGYFLGSVFGADRIALYGEQHPDEQTQRTIRVMPTVFIHQMVERNVDLLLNENSMPEMPECAVEEYIRLARRVVRGVFYSYNHETNRAQQGVPQVLVPAIVSRVGGFRRVSRDLSWIRRGYVEEVYLVLNTPGTGNDG
jgi:hypothetical protein